MTLADKPTGIIELVFNTPPTITGQIRAKLPTIEHYRSAGHTLRRIHSALVEGEHLSCSWRTFEKTYYRIRDKAAEHSPIELDSLEAPPPNQPKKSKSKKGKKFGFVQ